jgi:hypothetical protein
VSFCDWCGVIREGGEHRDDCPSRVDTVFIPGGNRAGKSTFVKAIEDATARIVELEAENKALLKARTTDFADNFKMHYLIKRAARLLHGTSEAESEVHALFLDCAKLLQELREPIVVNGKCEDAEIERLKEENAKLRALSLPPDRRLYEVLLAVNDKLRALVETAGQLDRQYGGVAMEEFCKECREALK